MVGKTNPIHFWLIHSCYWGKILEVEGDLCHEFRFVIASPADVIKLSVK